MEKFWNLDLSDINSLMADRYSGFGSVPRFPSDMLRSILLSVESKVCFMVFAFAKDICFNLPLPAVTQLGSHGSSAVV